MNVIKRKGEKQEFDERKLYASCYHSLLNAHEPKQEAEKICDKIIPDVKEAFKDKEEVDSQTLFEKTAEIIAKYHEDAAYLYKIHRDIS